MAPYARSPQLGSYMFPSEGRAPGCPQPPIPVTNVPWASVTRVMPARTHTSPPGAESQGPICLHGTPLNISRAFSR